MAARELTHDLEEGRLPADEDRSLGDSEARDFLETVGPWGAPPASPEAR